MTGHDTNKDRAQYRHITYLPNSYVNQHSVLIIIPDSDRTSLPRLVEMGNLALKEADYPFLFTSSSIMAYLKGAKVWVSNDCLALEQWPASAMSREPKSDSKMIYMIDVSDMENVY